MADTSRPSGMHYEIMRRCYDKNSVMYKKYGGVGIGVCKEWHERSAFIEWAYNNGWKYGVRLERIDASKDYSPSNCRFGTKYKSKGRKKTDWLPSKRYKVNPVRSILRGMHVRCENKSSKDYKYYGAKGICVCSEWSGIGGADRFWEWAKDNGWKKGLTIDRIDVNGNYSPDNCRWVTNAEQQNNRSDTQWFNYRGEQKNVAEIAKSECIPYNKAYNLLVNRKMDVGLYFDAVKAQGDYIKGSDY